MAQRVHEEMDRLERMSSLSVENRETASLDTETISSITESTSSVNLSTSTSELVIEKVRKLFL